MKIISSYGVELRKQNIPIRQTLEIYRSAVGYLVKVYESVWEELAKIENSKKRFNAAEHLVHTTKRNPARFDFDFCFPKMPSYFRRAAVQHALGSVSSYQTRLEHWKAEGQKKGKPYLESKQYAMPVFYHDVMYRKNTEEKDAAFLKLYDGRGWKWFAVRLKHTDMEYLRKHWSGQKSFGANTGEKAPQIFSAFYVYGRGIFKQNTCQRTDDLQCGSRNQYGCGLYHHASRRNYPGKKVYQFSQ